MITDKKRFTLILLFLFYFHPAQAEEPQRHEWSRPFMGTVFHITVYSFSQDNAQSAVYRAFDRIEKLEEILSFYREESELNQLAGTASSEAVIASPDLFRVLEASLYWSRKTEGAFDCTIRPLISLWHSRGKEGVLVSPDEIAEARNFIGFKKVLINPRLRSVRLLETGMQLDLGGIAKGYAADQALESLGQDGFSIVLIDAGGDLRLGAPPPGQKGWIITLDSSGDGPSRLLLANAAIATSGDKYKFYEIDGTRYSHIVNPETGRGMTDHRQVTVISEDAMTADALATALSVMDTSEGLELVNSQANTEALILVMETGLARDGNPEKGGVQGMGKELRSKSFPILF